MCKQFSCVVKKDLDVLWSLGVDSHTDILALNNLTDRYWNADRAVFCKVEVVPPNGNYFEKDLSKWVVTVDEQRIPSWWSDSHVEASKRALSRWYNEIWDGKNWNGYLDLSGTAITSLPEGLNVGGYLDLSGTAITSLPEGLNVGGDLDLRGTAITSLPEGLNVGGEIYR